MPLCSTHLNPLRWRMLTKDRVTYVPHNKISRKISLLSLAELLWIEQKLDKLRAPFEMWLIYPSSAVKFFSFMLELCIIWFILLMKYTCVFDSLDEWQYERSRVYASHWVYVIHSSYTYRRSSCWVTMQNLASMHVVICATGDTWKIEA